LTSVDVEMPTAALPITQAADDNPLVLLLHGGEDWTAPVEQFRSPGLDASVAVRRTGNGNAENWWAHD